MEVLIAEDEKQIALLLKKNLAEEGIHSTIANDGARVLELVKEIKFDIILLDWRMPKLSGIGVLKELKERQIKTPVILLTALSEVKNKLDAFNLGADDYITKPFQFDEVLARMNAVYRRYQSSQKIIEFSGLTLNLMDRKLQTPSGEVKLTEKEYDLLKFLLENKGKIISKEEICSSVWDLKFLPTTNIVEVTIKNLRRKLEENSNRMFIRTIYGEGYLFIGT